MALAGKTLKQGRKRRYTGVHSMLSYEVEETGMVNGLKREDETLERG
jgi:hypothetical protein